MSGEDQISPVTHTLLSNGTIQHAFFTRKGGVSGGIYAGLNVGSGSHDDPAHVKENRRRAAAHFGHEVAQIVTPWQVHSPDAVIVDGPFTGGKPQADGIATATPGVIIGVVTADCGPILFADEKAHVIGASHAGWKGALYGVLENTIQAMEKLGARRDRVKAVLGPSISQPNYEVSAEYRKNFTEQDGAYDRYFAPSDRSGHAMFDLRAFTLMQLQRAGVEATMTPDCTYADEANFFSYRRTTHRNEPDYGRQLSAISIRSA
jgi:polyphenol oxidase